MDSGVRRSLLWIAGFISLVLGLFLAKNLAPGTLGTEQLKELGYYRFDQPRVIQDFHLLDESGNEVDLDSLRGHWSLLFFGFISCPDVCPTTLSVLNEAVALAEEPPRVVLVSVDPERDTPEKLAGYVPRFNPSFRGYTGDFDQIVRLATSVNVAFGKVPGDEPGTYTVDHTASIVVVDPGGRYAGFIRPPFEAQRMARIMGNL